MFTIYYIKNIMCMCIVDLYERLVYLMANPYYTYISNENIYKRTYVHIWIKWQKGWQDYDIYLLF